jgi:hypothetical protein
MGKQGEIIFGRRDHEKRDVAGNEGSEDVVDHSSEAALKQSLVRRMAYYLTGNPVFKLIRKKSKFIKSLNTQRPNPLNLELEEACYVEVYEEHKFDATWHITSALHPGRLYSIMKDLDSRVDCTDDLKHLFGKSMSRYSEEGHSSFTIDVEESRFPTGLINEPPNMRDRSLPRPRAYSLRLNEHFASKYM